MTRLVLRLERGGDWVDAYMVWVGEWLGIGGDKGEFLYNFAIKGMGEGGGAKMAGVYRVAGVRK